MQRRSDDRVGPVVSQEISLIGPLRHLLATFGCPAGLGFHHLADRFSQLGSRVECRIEVAFDRDVHQVFAGGTVFLEVGRGDGSEHAGKIESRIQFVGDRRQCQSLGHLGRGPLGHVLDAAHQDDVIESACDGKARFAECPPARGTRTLGSGGGGGDEAKGIRENRTPVRLVDEEVVGEVAEVQRLDVGGVETLVY